MHSGLYCVKINPWKIIFWTKRGEEGSVLLQMQNSPITIFWFFFLLFHCKREIIMIILKNPHHFDKSLGGAKFPLRGAKAPLCAPQMAPLCITQLWYTRHTLQARIPLWKIIKITQFDIIRHKNSKKVYWGDISSLKEC